MKMKIVRKEGVRVDVGNIAVAIVKAPEMVAIHKFNDCVMISIMYINIVIINSNKSISINKAFGRV